MALPMATMPLPPNTPLPEPEFSTRAKPFFNFQYLPCHFTKLERLCYFHHQTIIIIRSSKPVPSPSQSETRPPNQRRIMQSGRHCRYAVMKNVRKSLERKQTMSMELFFFSSSSSIFLSINRKTNANTPQVYQFSKVSFLNIVQSFS